MDTLKYVKLENPDGSYSSAIPLAIDSDYVNVNGDTLTNKLNNKANRDEIDNLQNEINGLASGSPLVASSTSGMIQTNRVYVNTTDGNWYYYNGSAWTIGGTYQAAEDSNSVDQLLDYENELEKIIDNKSNLILSIVPGTYYTGSTGNSIVTHSNSSYNATVVRIPKSRKITSNANLSSSFSFVTDASGIVINLLSTYQDVDWVYQGFPNNAEFLYISRSGSLDNVVILDGDTTIKNIVTINDYPQNTITRVIIPKLYSNTINDYIDNIIHKKTVYETLYNTLENLCNSYSTFSNCTKINDNTFETTGNNGAAITNIIELNRYMKVSGEVTYGTGNGELLFGYYSDTWHYTANKDITSGINFSFVFDANYYKIYQSATKFRILIRPKNNALVRFTINEMEINEISDFELNDFYDYNFKEMMSKVFNGISSGGGNVQSNDNKFLTSPNGNNFILNIDNNGTLSAIKTIPNKVLFMGNSLLLGMNSSASHEYVYGMCASSPSNDYFYYVKQAILNKNANATFNKVHGAQIEQMGTSDSLSTLWNTTNNYYTGEPLKNSFTSDLDLIIIQISDNMNTEDRRNAFVQNADTLMTYIKTASPNARIIWVDGWFGYSNTHQIILNNCKKWNIENIAINDLHTTANEGYSGQTYINGSGQTATVSDSWITHPGNDGMEAIANRIIDTLNM